MSGMSVSWGECYYDHFVRFMGEPAGREVFTWHEDKPVIQVMPCPSAFPSFQTLCSLGLSHYSRDVGGVAEVFTVAEEHWGNLTSLLVSPLFLLVRTNTKLKRGLSICRLEELDPAFASTFGKTAIYFTYPWVFQGSFSKVSCGDDYGFIYQAAFISQAEHNFLEQNGVERFETLLEEKDVDPVSLSRPSCI